MAEEMIAVPVSKALVQEAAVDPAMKAWLGKRLADLALSALENPDA